MLRRPWILFLMTTVMTLMTVKARAEGFALYEWGARGIALGGATVARKKADPSAVAANPALITKLPGSHVMGGFATVSPRGSIKYTDNATGERGQTSLKPMTWVMPHLYYTQQLTDKFYFGIGQFTRFGLGFEYPHNWKGRFNVYKVSLKTTSVNPNLAWAITDNFSIAAGVELMYLDLHLNSRSLNGPYEIDTDINHATSWGLGYNLAMHWDIDDQWSVGLSYRSRMKHRAEGESEMRIVGGAEISTPDVKGQVTLPDSIHGAVAYQATEDLSIEIGAIYTRWSSFDKLDIYFQEPQNTSKKMPKDWRNAWRFNIGVEYEALDWLTLRAGYVFDRSPMTDGHADYLVPTNDRHIYSLGLGFHWDNWTVDLAYAYIDALGRDYDARPSDGVMDSKTSGDTHVTSLSLGYRF